MIDLHLLPGLDDGPGIMDEAVALCRQAWGDGIVVAVATPPAFTPAWLPEPDGVRRGVAELSQRLVFALQCSLNPGLVDGGNGRSVASRLHASTTGVGRGRLEAWSG